LITLDQYLESIRDELERTKLPKYLIAEQSGIAPNTLTGIEEAAWTASFATLRKLEKFIADWKTRDQ
jgi:hypothetical protein